MTIADFKEMYKGEYDYVEVYRCTGKKRSLGFDFTKELESYDEEWEVDIVRSGLFGEQEYNDELLANTSSVFTDMFDQDEKVLVILLEK